MTFYLIKDEGGTTQRIASNSEQAQNIINFLEEAYDIRLTQETVTITDTDLQNVYSVLASEL